MIQSISTTESKPVFSPDIKYTSVFEIQYPASSVAVIIPPKEIAISTILIDFGSVCQKIRLACELANFIVVQGKCDFVQYTFQLEKPNKIIIRGLRNQTYTFGYNIDFRSNTSKLATISPQFAVSKIQSFRNSA
jgi:hypothetical protein